MQAKEELDKILNDFWEWYLEASPEFATTCNVHKYNDRLEEFTEEAFEKKYVKCKAYAEDLKKVSPS